MAALHGPPGDPAALNKVHMLRIVRPYSKYFVAEKAISLLPWSYRAK
jgi:hypothetical protein